jgi:hypothetical protein
MPEEKKNENAKKPTDQDIISQLPEPEKALTVKANNAFKGRKCLGGRYLTDEESRNMGWGYRPFALFFEGGVQAYPSSDDEGNEAGVLFVAGAGEFDTIPVLRHAKP